MNGAPSVGFAFDSQQGTHGLGSDRRSDFYASANTLAFLPSACDVFSESAQGGEYLKVTGLNAYALPLFDSQPFTRLANRHVIEVAQKLRKVLLSWNPKQDPEYLEQIIIHWIAGIDCSRITAPSKRMPRSRMKQIEAHIDNNLGLPLSVFSLASEFGLSAGYFSREFTNAFGQSPYEFIIGRRVCLARAALKSKASLTDIALEHGFNSHAHMSAAFQRRLGISPRMLRSRQP